MPPEHPKPPRQDQPGWGLLPAVAIARIKRREWDNPAALRARLSGEKPFPIRIGLKPPNGPAAVSDVAHFQRFVGAWRAFPHQEMVRWSKKNLRDLSGQDVPVALEIGSVEQLIRLMGDEGLARSRVWKKNMAPILEIEAHLYPALIKHIDTVERLSPDDARLLARLLPQLRAGLGGGEYVRALPLMGVDTKFLENHLALVEELADTLHAGAVLRAGGLLGWLDCQAAPRGWLTIRPLCHGARAALGGLPILRLPGAVLANHELPAGNILIVENQQSGLALPAMENTVAVMGGGKNIAWMAGAWLQKKRVGYWGDIDTWGLTILGDARGRLKNLESIMMDRATVEAHEDRMVPEPGPVFTLPPSLREKEKALFNDLISDRFRSTRLEQERLSPDYIRQRLREWLSRERRD